MRRRALAAGGLLGFVCLFGAAAACLDPLPAPLDCPLVAEHPYCAPLEGGAAPDADPAPPVPSNGPVILDVACPLDRTCLVGSGRTCACSGEGECPAGAPVCYPAGDCPATLRARSPSATCLPLAGTSFLYASTSDTSCTCGCAACAGAQDGVGPILSAAVLEVPLGGGVPTSGTVSFYARWRGDGTLTATFLDIAGDALASGVVDVATGGVFAEAVSPADAVSGAVIAYSWSPGVLPPALLTIDPGSDTAVEVDSLVVFVTP
jgi:hypothetical protein